jgi:hypothetical protein
MVCESLNERQRRIWAGVEATALGQGGVSAVARATGMSWRRVKQAMEDLSGNGGKVPADAFDGTSSKRQAGAGRKPVASIWPSLPSDVMAEFSGGKLLRGEMSSFHWSTQSTRGLAERLSTQHDQSVSATYLAGLLRQLGFRIGKDTRVKPLHAAEQRHAQFKLAFQAMKQTVAAGQAVLYLNLDRRALPSHDADHAIEQVLRAAAPRSAPGAKESFSADTVRTARQACREGVLLPQTPTALASWKQEDPDVHTAAFAMQVVRRWWDQFGSDLYASTGEVLLCVNGFGQEGDLQDYWIRELSRWARELRIGIRMCFIPIGMVRPTPVSSQPTTLLLMRDGGGRVVRHQAELSVLPRYIGRPDLRGTFSFNELGSAARWRISQQEMELIKLRRGKTMSNWNFSVS